jgi:hypothetical protein
MTNTQSVDLAIQQRIELAANLIRSQRIVLAVTNSHITSPFPQIGFTFDEQGLARSLEDPSAYATVHHGSFGGVKPGFHTLLMEERLSVFACKSRAPMALTAAAAISVLRGEIERWSSLGFEGDRIRVLAHADPIHLMSLLQLVGLARGELRSDVDLYGSYKALARAGARERDCLIFGLRPTHTLRAGLYPVAVNGVYPWNFDRRELVPGQRISIVWPENYEWTAAKEKITFDYLQSVHARVAADLEAVTAFATMPERWPPARTAAA